MVNIWQTIGAKLNDSVKRQNHTGQQSLDTTTDSATRLAMSPAQRDRLASLAPVAFVPDPLNPGYYYNVDSNGQIIYPADQITYSTAQKYLKIGGGGTVTGISQARTGTGPSAVTSLAIRTDTPIFHHWDPTTSTWIQDQRVSTFGSNLLGNPGGASGRSVAPSQPLRHWLFAMNDIWKTNDEGASWTSMGLTIPNYSNDDWRQGNPRVAIDPRNPDHVIVGTQSNGMLRTIDGGTFTQVTLPVDPQQASRTWTGSSGYGNITRPNNGSQSCPGILVRFDPTSGAGTDGLTLRVYAIVSGVAVLRSDDSGRTWQNINAPWPIVGRGFSISTHNGDVAITSPGPSWSIKRTGATTGGTFTITITDSAGSATTTPLDHHATGPDIVAALNATGKGSWESDNFVNTTTWVTTKIIDFLVRMDADTPVPAGGYTMTLNSQVTGGTLSMIEDTVASAYSSRIKMARYRPGSGWSDITPGTRNFGTVVYSPHTPGHMMTAALGPITLTNRIRISTDYGDTWGSPSAITVDQVNSDVRWQANLAANQGLQISFASAVWDLDDPNTVIVTEGIGVWRHTMSDLTNHPATITLTTQTSGIEEMIGNDIAILPGRTPGADTRVMCASWDRALFVLTDRTKNPVDYKPDSTFGSGWSIATLPGDPDFAILATMNHQDGSGSGRSSFSIDGGDTWTPFSLPDTTNNSWGQGQVCPSTRSNWIAVAPSKAPKYTLDAGATWSTVVLPTGANDATKFDTTQSAQFANRRSVVAVGPLWFIAMVKNVGVFETRDGGATWTQKCAWAAVNMGSSNDGFPARLSAVNSQTGDLGGGSKAHLWWVTGSTRTGAYFDVANKAVRSVDGGATWQVIPGIGTAHCVAFSPTFDESPGYLTLMTGFDLSGQQAIMFSADQGATWRKVGGPLNDMFVTGRAGAGDRSIPGRFYIAGGTGFYQIDVTRTLPA